MAQKLSPVIYRDWQYGMNDSVCNFLLPEQYLRLALNVTTDEGGGNELGNVKGLTGYSQINDAAVVSGNSILGLGSYVDYTSGTLSTEKVVMVNNSGDTASNTYFDNGSAWQQIGVAGTNFTADTKARFAMFLDLLWVGNGVDAIMTWGGVGTSEWGTTQATDAPIGSLLVPFYSRMNIAGNPDYPSRLYYSDFVDTDGNIAWNDDYIEFNSNDGDIITALERNGALLLIFKNRRLYTWDGVQTQPDPIFDVGTPAQEGVVTVRGITFFFGVVGDEPAIFQYRGDYPTEISRPMRRWLLNMDSNNFDNVVSWNDEDHVFFSVGDVTIDQIDYSNVVLRYCISKDSWSVLTLGHAPTVAMVHTETDNSKTLMFGDDSGSVYEFDGSYDYAGGGIEYKIRTKELEFGSRNIEKTINRFYVYSNNPQGMNIRVRVDGKQWHDLGHLKKPVEDVECNLQGRWFEFEVSGLSNGIEPFSFDGFEFVDIKTERYAE